MKKETKTLFVGIFVGLLTGLIGDYIFEARTEIGSVIQQHPALALISIIVVASLAHSVLSSKK